MLETRASGPHRLESTRSSMVLIFPRGWVRRSRRRVAVQVAPVTRTTSSAPSRHTGSAWRAECGPRRAQLRAGGRLSMLSTMRRRSPARHRPTVSAIDRDDVAAQRGQPASTARFFGSYAPTARAFSSQSPGPASVITLSSPVGSIRCGGRRATTPRCRRRPCACARDTQVAPARPSGVPARLPIRPAHADQKALVARPLRRRHVRDGTYGDGYFPLTT